MNGFEGEEIMTDRYICSGCKEISDKKKKCPHCGEPMRKVTVTLGFERWFPYLMAGTAVVLLTLGFVLEEPILTWFTFPLIAAGLLFDHLYQKQVDEAIEGML